MYLNDKLLEILFYLCINAIPAEAQVAVVVPGRFGSFHAGRALGLGGGRSGRALLRLAGSRGCFLWAAVAGVAASTCLLFLTRLLLLLVLLGRLRGFLAPSAGLHATLRLLVLRGLVACLGKLDCV